MPRSTICRNRLVGETSPYLRQHAQNPVDWYPWGEEALDRARTERKPIFLSIGYSSCHWCHVMERESFEDPETAKILDEHFIAIKVDREEHPDLDDIYMTAVQMLTGRGGWPLSVFLTPDRKPFFGGTYFPPADRFGMPGFKNVLVRVAELWREQAENVTEHADKLVRALAAIETFHSNNSTLLDRSIIDRAVEELRQDYDSEWGGFGQAPKFPPCGAVALLLRQYHNTGAADLIHMATVTLDRMASGGIHDQLGGGFHRYSVDTKWLVPHFEKMLYDNALLSKVYLEAWQATGKDLYRQVAMGILDYVLRDMADPQGGFFSAEDADSDGEEGKFYVWKPDEIEAVLGIDDGKLFCQYYGVEEAGHFEGASILNRLNDPADFNWDRKFAENEIENRLPQWRQKLLAKRNQRVRPAKDDKVLAAWNGMMISALAKGYQVLGDQRYQKAAKRAADFVLNRMIRDGTLLRSYRILPAACGAGKGEDHGVAKLPGYLDDYAEMATGLIDLYEATFQWHWCEAADQLVREMIVKFWDPRDGGFFYTSVAHRHLLVRTKPAYDGAVPSGNATAAQVLLRLSKLTGIVDYADKVEILLSGLQDSMRSRPRAHLDLLSAAERYLHPGPDIVIAGQRDHPDIEKFLMVIHKTWLPNKILMLAEPDPPDSPEIHPAHPLLVGKTMVSDKMAVYVCQNFICQQPVTDPGALQEMMHRSQELNASKHGESIMQRYVCDVCGWVYDPEEGSPDTGIEPGALFEDLPDDFECPECGAGIDEFLPEK